jgi:hypothetical protein
VTTVLATLAVAGGGDRDTTGQAFDNALRRLYGDAARVDNPRRQTWQQTLDEGWAALDALEPKAKQALVEAMVVSVLEDGTVTTSEAELLRAACGLMHVRCLRCSAESPTAARICLPLYGPDIVATSTIWDSVR